MSKIYYNCSSMFFRENVLKAFVTLAKVNNTNIRFTLVKQLSVITPSIKDNQNILLFCSNNYINQLIRILYQTEQQDEDYIVYYANFLKSLSQKVDNSILNLFIDYSENTFPLLDNALLLTNDKDDMIKNTGRNIFLSILKMNNIIIDNYLCNPPIITFFIYLPIKLVHLIKEFSEALQNKSNERELIKEFNENIQNEILFFQDIFSVGNKKVIYILTNCIFSQLILPYLCNNLVKEKDYELSIYILWEILNFIKDEHFINLLVVVLFDEELHHRVIGFIDKNINYQQYEKYFNTNSNKINSLEDYIISNFSDGLLKNFLNNTRIDTFEEGKIIKETIIQKKENQQTDINQLTLIEISSYFQKKEISIDIVKEYHSYLSLVTGIECGIDYNNSKKSFIQIMNKVYSNEVKQNKFKKNIIKNAIVNLFFGMNLESQSFLLMYNSLILYDIVFRNQIINKEILTNLSLIKNRRQQVNKPDIIDINATDDDFLFYKESVIQDGKVKEKPVVSIINYSSYNHPNKYENFIYFNKDYYDNCNYFISTIKYPIIDIVIVIVQLLEKTSFQLSKLTLRILIALLMKIPTQNKKQMFHIINNIYLNTLCQINNELYNGDNSNEFYRDCLYLFEEEFISYKADFDEVIQYTLKQPILSLYDYINDEDINSIFTAEYIVPKTDKERYRNLIMKYLLISHIRSMMVNKPTLFNSECPISIESDNHEMGSIYDLSYEKKTLYKVKYKITKDKSSESLFFFLDKDCIFLVSFNKKEKVYIVKHKHPISQIDVIYNYNPNKSIRRTITLNVYENEKRESYEEINIEFEHRKDKYHIQKEIEDDINRICLMRYTLVITYFENLIKTCVKIAQ